MRIRRKRGKLLILLLAALLCGTLVFAACGDAEDILNGLGIDPGSKEASDGIGPETFEPDEDTFLFSDSAECETEEMGPDGNVNLTPAFAEEWLLDGSTGGHISGTYTYEDDRGVYCVLESD